MAKKISLFWLVRAHCGSFENAKPSENVFTFGGHWKLRITQLSFEKPEF